MISDLNYNGNDNNNNSTNHNKNINRNNNNNNLIETIIIMMTIIKITKSAKVVVQKNLQYGQKTQKQYN